MSVLIFLFLIFSFLGLFSQTEIPQNGFEEWTEVLNNDNELMYEEPAGQWWTSLNKLRLLGGPVTSTKTEDAHSGTFAARMETMEWGTFKITGLLVSGFFDTKAPPPNNLLEGQPFSGRPLAFEGWYKYLPTKSDSGLIFIALTKYNSQTGIKDTIAVASSLIIYETKEYTKFRLNLNYYNDFIPDSITIIILSSAGGKDFSSEGSSQTGSVIIVDDLSLNYQSGTNIPLMEENNFKIFVRNDKLITLILPERLPKGIINIFDIKGNCVLQQDYFGEKEINLFLSDCSSGTYFLNLSIDQMKIFNKKFQLSD